MNENEKTTEEQQNETMGSGNGMCRGQGGQGKGMCRGTGRGRGGQGRGMGPGHGRHDGSGMNAGAQGACRASETSEG